VTESIFDQHKPFKLTSYQTFLWNEWYNHWIACFHWKSLCAYNWYQLQVEIQTTNYE